MSLDRSSGNIQAPTNQSSPPPSPSLSSHLFAPTHTARPLPLPTRHQRTPRIIRPRQQLIRLIRIRQRRATRLVPQHHSNLPQNARNSSVVTSRRSQLRYVACFGEESERRVHISHLEFDAAERIVGGCGDGMDGEFGGGDGEGGFEGAAGTGVQLFVELDVAVGVMAAVERVSDYGIGLG